MKTRDLVYIFIILLVIAGGLFYYQTHRETVYNYSVTLPIGERQSADFVYGPEPLFAHPEFFQKAKQQFIDNKTDFIEADLSEMKLRVYKKGSTTLEVAIAAKAKEGTWWETPAGLYKVQGKEKKHFSSFEHVYMNYNILFDGNFFIHGWPYYASGGKVTSQFSAGCIRLTDADAEKVYNEAANGMPVMVYEKSLIGDDFSYISKPPEITAQKYLVADLNNAFVFMSKDSQVGAPMGHIVHVIDALAASEYMNFSRSVKITSTMLATTTKPRLKVGQTVPLYSLLYPLLLENSNEAASAMAESAGNKYFTSLIKNKAKAFGMNDTTIVDPVGSNLENISTAKDLFSLAQYVYNNRSFVLNISAENNSTNDYGDPIFNDLTNMNLLRSAGSGLVGSIVGHRSDGLQTLFSVYNLSIKGVTRPVVLILLGSSDAQGDADKIREYVTNNYK